MKSLNIIRGRAISPERLSLSSEAFSTANLHTTDGHYLLLAKDLMNSHFSWNENGGICQKELRRGVAVAVTPGHAPFVAVSTWLDASRSVVPALNTVVGNMMQAGVHLEDGPITVYAVGKGVDPDSGRLILRAFGRPVRLVMQDLESDAIREAVEEPWQGGLNDIISFRGGDYGKVTNPGFAARADDFLRRYSGSFSAYALCRGPIHTSNANQLIQTVIRAGFPLKALADSVSAAVAEKIQEEAFMATLAFSVVMSTKAYHQRSGVFFGTALLTRDEKWIVGGAAAEARDAETSGCSERNGLGNLVLNFPEIVPPTGEEVSFIALFSAMGKSSVPCNRCIIPLNSYAAKSPIVCFSENEAILFDNPEQAYESRLHSFHDGSNGKRKS